jgi:DNA-binding XRE family transcriptional regulator
MKECLVLLLQVSLEALRKNKKMTQSKASKEIGVSLSTYQAWERGERYPKQPKIEKICEVFECSYDNIFFG